MAYLFGDSTPSALELNFIEFLKHALDFGVEALLRDERLAKGRERRRARELAADQEVERLEALGGTVREALETAQPNAGSPAARCAAQIDRAAADAVRAEIAAVKAACAADLEAIDAEAAADRRAVVKAFEALLLRHDLPQTRTTLLVTSEAGRYVARLRGETAYGIDTIVELEIPPGDPFSHELRVDRLLEGLEVHAPEQGGFLRKGTRLVAHKLGKHHVTELVIAPERVSVKLRLDGAPGFDVELDAEAMRARLLRVGKDGEVPVTVDELPDADGARLLELGERLRAATAALPLVRKALLDARVGGRPVLDDDHPEGVIERLVGAMAPTAIEIAKHSLSPTELVLKRLLADDRREEIFVSRAELIAKLAPLSPAQREAFAPLGLVPVGNPATDERAPTAPIAGKLSASQAAPLLAASSGTPPVAAKADAPMKRGDTGTIELEVDDSWTEEDDEDDEPSPRPM